MDQLETSYSYVEQPARVAVGDSPNTVLAGQEFDGTRSIAELLEQAHAVPTLEEPGVYHWLPELDLPGRKGGLAPDSLLTDVIPFLGLDHLGEQLGDGFWRGCSRKWDHLLLGFSWQVSRIPPESLGALRGRASPRPRAPAAFRAQESSVCRTEEAAAEEPGALTCGRRRPFDWSGGIGVAFCGSWGGRGTTGQDDFRDQEAQHGRRGWLKSPLLEV